jgi:2-O-methyltransferase
MSFRADTATTAPADGRSLRMDIKDWVRRTFAGPEPKTIIELGSHVGQDTVWLAQIPGAKIHAWEPDPRNRQRKKLPNVTVHRLAVAARDGTCAFILSATRNGRPYTKSSSIRRPKTHLTRVPDVTFGETIRVRCTKLDTFVETKRINQIAFQWWDIQGAEGDAIRGGQEALRRTRYLYTEVCDVEEYEGQITLAQMLDLLPAWRIVHQWEHDVLLKNTTWPLPWPY